MKNKKYSEILSNMLQRIAEEKFGDTDYFLDEFIISRVDALLSEFPILKNFNLYEMSLDDMLILLNDIFIYMELVDNRGGDDCITLCFEVNSELKLISQKEIFLIFLLIILQKNKVKHINLYFLAGKEKHVDITEGMKSWDCLDYDSYMNTFRISFTVKDYLNRCYEIDTLNDSLKKIILKKKMKN